MGKVCKTCNSQVVPHPSDASLWQYHHCGRLFGHEWQWGGGHSESDMADLQHCIPVIDIQNPVPNRHIN